MFYRGLDLKHKGSGLIGFGTSLRSGCTSVELRQDGLYAHAQLTAARIPLEQ